jgi:hypothetical protein
MISLASEMTDGKGRHARRWLSLMRNARFVHAWPHLLGLPPHKLLQTIRFVNSDSLPYAGADALIRVAEEFWWPVRWPERQESLA